MKFEKATEKDIELIKCRGYMFLSSDVGGQDYGPIESRYFSDFFILSVQVLVPSHGQENSPNYRLDKDLTMFPCNFIKLTGRLVQSSHCNFGTLNLKFTYKGKEVRGEW